MAINFPNNPVLNQTFTDSATGFVFQWNGTVWKSFPTSTAGISTYANNAGIATNVVGGIASVTSLNVSGISTLGNTIVGGATTQLIVNGNARITGILTIGTSSLTLDGTNNQINIGTGVTIKESGTASFSEGLNVSGVITATSFIGDGSNLTGIGVTRSLTIGTRSVAYSVNAVGTGITLSLRSGIGTASF